MLTPVRPSVVAFDVVQTLMSLAPLGGRFTAIGLPADTVQHWFDRLLREGMALTLAGDYATFPEVAASALRSVAGQEVGDDSVDHVLAGFGELPAHADAEPAMRLLADAGITQVCLTNGAARTTEGFLERTGLRGYVEQVISVEDVRRWKPSPEVYAYALRCVRTPAVEVALVAVHAFDCHGARRAGMTTGWASRLEQEYPSAFERADITGDDLAEVARGLIALPPA